MLVVPVHAAGAAVGTCLTRVLDFGVRVRVADFGQRLAHARGLPGGRVEQHKRLPPLPPLRLLGVQFLVGERLPRRHVPRRQVNHLVAALNAVLVGASLPPVSYADGRTS